MEDQDKNLEQFFNKKFAQKIEAEPWNTPTEDVWEAVAAGIAPEKRKRRGLGLLFLLLLGVLSLASTGYYYHQWNVSLQQIKALEIKLEDCKSPENSAAPSYPPLQESTQSASTYSESSPLRGQIDETVGAVQVVLKAKQQKLTSFPKGEHRNSFYPSGRILADSSLETFENTVFTPTVNPHPNSEVQVNNSISWRDPINPLQSLRYGLLGPPFYTAPRLKIPNVLPGLIAEKDKKASVFQIGLSSAVLFWRDRFEGKLAAPLSELLQKETTSPSFSFGLDAQKGLSKHWAIAVGLAYSNRKSISHYALSIPYTLSTEQASSDGSLDNRFNHSLPSGLGSVNTALVLNRSMNTSVADQEKVNLDFAFQHETKSIFMPIRVTYFPKSVGKGLFFALGFQNEFNVQTGFKVLEAVSHHSSIHEKSVVITPGSSQQRKYNLKGSVNIGFQQPLTDQLSVVVHAGYKRALIASYTQGQFSHKMDNWSLGMGLLKGF